MYDQWSTHMVRRTRCSFDYYIHLTKITRRVAPAVRGRARVQVQTMQRTWVTIRVMTTVTEFGNVNQRTHAHMHTHRVLTPSEITMWKPIETTLDESQTKFMEWFLTYQRDTRTASNVGRRVENAWWITSKQVLFFRNWGRVWFH